MAFRKTNIGALITYDPKEATKQLLVQFSKHKGVYSDVGTHYGVATTTVRRWVTTLADALPSSGVQAKVERIRELAIELE